jgi:hypothetical protein
MRYVPAGRETGNQQISSVKIPQPPHFLDHLGATASAGLRTAMQGSRSPRVTWLTLLSVYCQGSYDIVVGALTRAVLGGTHD